MLLWGFDNDVSPEDNAGLLLKQIFVYKQLP